MSQIDENNIRYIQNGEPHHEETYNRPIGDVVSEANQALEQVNNAALDNAIVYAIALG